MKSRFVLPALGMSLLFSSIASQAYDIDTHFYATYAMARYAGIKHEVASHIAMYTQWMDESSASSPVKVFPALFGLKKRRMFHFPDLEKAGKLDELQYKLGDKQSGLKQLTETVPNSPVASELMIEGMKRGWLLEASASLHVLEDSYAHAGTDALEGHAPEGHWPDRPFNPDGSIAKYYEMVSTVFRALTAMRELLPADAIDRNVTDTLSGNTTPNYLRDAATLADGYKKIPLVRATIEHDVLTDPAYVRYVVVFLLHRCQTIGYIAPGFDFAPWLRQLSFDGRDTRTVLKDLGLRLLAYQQSTGREILRVDAILNDLGYQKNDPAYVASLGGPEKVVELVVEEITRNWVPHPFSATHRHEFEVEGPTREREMQIRVQNMRNLIRTLYGINVRFEGLHDETPLLKREATDVVVRMSPGVQKMWDRMINTFMLPTVMSNNPLQDYLTFSIVTNFFVYWRDITQNRITPEGDELDYQVPVLFEKLKTKGIMKPLLAESQLRMLERLRQPGQDLDGTGLLYRNDLR